MLGKFAHHSEEEELASIIESTNCQQNKHSLNMPSKLMAQRTTHNDGKIAYTNKQIRTSQLKGIVFACLFIIMIVLIVFIRSSLMSTQSFLLPQQKLAHHYENVQSQQKNQNLPVESKEQIVQGKSSQINDKNEQQTIGNQMNVDDKQNLDKKISEMKAKLQLNKNLTPQQNFELFSYYIQKQQKQPEKLQKQIQVMTDHKLKAAQRRKKLEQKTKQLQQENILKDIKNNPYNTDQYAFITNDDLNRAKRWRYIATLNYDDDTPTTREQKAYYQQKYNIDQYEEKSFCLVVPTYNNKARKRYLRNLKSILMQDYSNYHLVVIDDGSNDGTGAQIQKQLQNQTKIPVDRYKVVIYQERHFAMPNLRWAATSFCKPDDIFMIVDGDDELLGRQVLKLFNAVFQQKKIWFMYTNFLGSNGKMGYSRPYPSDIIQNSSYRQYSFTVSHLRAYYTKLFLNINEEDLQDENGHFFTSANDMAISIPVMEQAHTRVAYIPQLTYFYNFNTGANVHRNRLQQQRQNNLKIRAKQKYTPLQNLFPQNDYL